MTPDIGGARQIAPRHRGRHRTPRKRQQILIRTVWVSGAAACIGLVAEINAPDAEALSLLLPSGNGNATQINILEGNVIDPQIGVGDNTSNNSTIGGLLTGLGNKTIALGGATGNGN